ncbi:MAG: RraA family protein [Acidobacteriota bacterium]|nr:RraA family protein [Acidobacteriota bacterium]
MNHTDPLRTVSEETVRQLQQFDTCTVSNAIEQFRIRTRSEGFVNGSVRCIFPDLKPKVGYAATARIRTLSTPIGRRCYYDRLDWWHYVQTIPAPRFVVVEDVDHVPGLGALVGEIHANICVALGCVALLTNGSVRDLPGVKETGLQMFAGSVAVSHSYAHVVEFGDPVEVGGLQIKPGNLLHGDQHGVVCVPLAIAGEVPKAAAELLESEKELIELCRSREFSFQKLCAKIERVSEKVGAPDKDPR